MRLVNWDKVLEWMHRQKETTEQWSMRIAIENYVDDMPTVDAVEVVRCCSCKHRDGVACDYSAVWVKPHGYCQWGERREDETD